MRNTHLEEYGEELPEEASEMVPVGLNPQNDPEMFYAVSNHIQAYLNYNSVKFETRDDKTVEQKGKIVLNILSENYKKKNNITSRNIKEYMYDGDCYLSFYPLKMNEIMEGQIFTNVVYGFLEDEITGEYVQDAYYIVRLDTSTNAIDIEPVNNVTNINQVTLSSDTTSIKLNDNNKFISSTVNI
ncbi:MAG: hypothetical protein K2H53_03805, partial [Clostridia bacterium]|nr:hypothetical protein [Clostridia bacterium]